MGMTKILMSAGRVDRLEAQHEGKKRIQDL
jgi:hypothetical protein